MKAFAAELLRAWDTGRCVPSIAARAKHFDWEDAYGISAELIRLRRARGEKTVGRKIGFTNRNIWPQYGATSPIWAPVYDSTVIHAKGNQATLSLRGSIAPRLEPEIAFMLHAPVPAGCQDASVIVKSIAWLAPSFEIVDCRFPDWKFTPADSAADQALHWRLIVGEPHPVQASEIADLVDQLRDCKVALKCNGAVMDRGSGANALGHPALALAFLADILATQPRMDALAAGEIVTTGTLTAALPVQARESWTSEIEGLPVAPLTVAFTQ